jgi:hypothetical protein
MAMVYRFAGAAIGSLQAFENVEGFDVLQFVCRDF